MAALGPKQAQSTLSGASVRKLAGPARVQVRPYTRVHGANRSARAIEHVPPAERLVAAALSPRARLPLTQQCAPRRSAPRRSTP